MTNNSEGINALVCAIDDLKKSSMIYVDKRIGSVLKCLAYYKEFREVLTACSKGFDYSFEKGMAFSKLGDNYVVKLPSDGRRLVALICNLLVEFDAGSVGIFDFVGAYFPAPTQQESLDKFYASVLDPFKQTVVRYVWEGVEEQPAAPIERDVKFASSGLKKRTEYLMYNISKALHEFEGEGRADYIVMLEALAAAIDSRDSLMIRALWIAVRRALEAEDLCAKERAEFDGVLKLYMIAK